MSRRPKVLALLGIVVGVMGLVGPRARAESGEGVRVEVVLTSEESGEPISGASVYLKFKQKRLFRRDKKTEWSVKTNKNGRAIFPAVPEGNALVQIVAKGWKTYGKYHDLEGPKHVLEIKLKTPKKWY